MKSLKFALLTVIALFSTVISFAHEGHGIVNDNSWLHQLTSSEHLGTVVVGIVAIIAFLLIYGYKKATSRK